MTDRRTITDAFQRHEDEAGGYAAPGGDAKTICERVAAELGLSYEEVRAVMLDTWCGTGGG